MASHFVRFKVKVQRLAPLDAPQTTSGSPPQVGVKTSRLKWNLSVSALSGPTLNHGRRVGVWDRFFQSWDASSITFGLGDNHNLIWFRWEHLLGWFYSFCRRVKTYLPTQVSLSYWCYRKEQKIGTTLISSLLEPSRRHASRLQVPWQTFLLLWKLNKSALKRNRKRRPSAWREWNQDLEYDSGCLGVGGCGGRGTTD